MLRIHYPEACYHVINRGDYRYDIFATEGAANAFAKALLEAVQRYGWILYAYTYIQSALGFTHAPGFLPANRILLQQFARVYSVCQLPYRSITSDNVRNVAHII